MRAMFLVTIERTFRAAHALRCPDGSWESPHDHDWHTVVEVARGDLDEFGTVMDFHVLERIVEEVISPLFSSDLNKHSYFNKLVPSAENVARFLFERIDAKLHSYHVRLRRVTVSEAPGCCATFLDEEA
jgi:6-pyruvoyltetrahydropterin/6-carboxytetrahydropterin synthase